MSHPLRRIAARTAVLYSVVAGLWIVGSDWLVDALVRDHDAIRALQTYKGWFFVACTAVLLYVTLRAELGRFAAESAARQSAEGDLRAAEERLRQVVESIREVFWLRDARDGSFQYVSPAYESVWGRGAARLIADPAEWLDAVHPEDAERAAEVGSRALSGESYDLEYRIVRPDGATRWVRELGFPVRDAAGEVVRLSGVAEDVTERRVLAEQLQQTQRLESIGLLAGGVAHDFNNLLTVISGNVEMLLLELEGRPELVTLAAEIQHAGERAGSLTRQLLAFSRREVLEPRVLDLDAVVVDTEKMLRRLLGEDIVLDTHLGSSGCFLRADPGHLVQVLMNLAVNARDAMPRGGRLAISTAVVSRQDGDRGALARLPEGRYVELTVTDSGCGMTDEVRAHAFEPFFTTKGAGRGTGLGLAVVHGIVRQSGGDAEIESTLGEGTSFRLWFPVCAGAALERPNFATQARGREQVLLVEDDEGVRRFAWRGLEALGYGVTTAVGSATALEVFDSSHKRFDILVTDVVMPGLDGRELADAARARWPWIRVLYTSGYTDDAVVRRGVLHREVPFLQKPYTATALARKIREVLDGPTTA